MGQNNFILDLIAGLKKTASTKQIKSDIKQIENPGLKIKLIGFLNKTKTREQLKKDIANIEVPVQLTGKLDKTKTKAQVKQDLESLNGTVNLTGKVNKKGVTTSVQQTTEQAQSQVDKTPIQVSFSLRKDKLINDIKVFGQQNSKMFKDANMSAKYNSLLDNAKLATSSKELKNLRLQLSAMRSEIKATHLSGMTLGNTFKKTFKRATELFAGTGGIMLLTQQMRQAWTEALNLDKAYTDLIKVQNELSRGDYPEYLERCNKKAQELATTQQSLIEGTTEFSKSGYDLTTSNKLTEQSTILSNVGEMSASDSAKAIISGIQAYEQVDGYTDAVDKAQALIDKYNEIGNTASITTEEIAKGVQAVGSVFGDANTSVDQFIALLAAGNRQYQDADALALGLRTAALRIRGCTVELEQMGEETDGVYTSASKLQEKIADLTNVDGNGGVRILEADGETFRSIYDIFLDISKVSQKMSDTDLSALNELISGKHRANAISATLNNMSEAQEIYQHSLEASGSAQREYDKYLESSEASLNRFKSSMTETYQSVIDGETVTGLLNCSNATLQFINSLGLVESTLKGLVAIGIVKAITTLSTAFKASAIQASNFGTALNTVKNMSAMARGATEYTNALKALKTVSAGLSDTQIKQVLASKALSDSDRIAILRTTGLTKAQAQAKLAQMGLTQSTKAQTTANASATASTFSLTAAIKGFSTTAKAALMNNWVGISIMAISTIIGAVSSKVSEYNQKMEEARQADIDAATTASEHAKELNGLYAEYTRLASISNRTSSQEEEFNEIVKNITKSLGDKAEALKGLTAGTDEYTESLKSATKAEIENYYTTAVTGRKAAEEELQKSVYDSWDGSQITIQMNTQMTGVENHMKALESVRDILSEFEDDGMNGKEWEPINWDKNKKDMDAVVEYYNALSEARKKLILEAQSTGDDTLLDSDIYKDIDTTINMLSEDVQTYIEKRYEELKLEYEMQNGIPSTVEEYNKMKESLQDSSNAGDYFNKTVTELLSNDFTDLTNEIQNVADSSSKMVSTFDSSDFLDSISSIQSKYESLLSAQKEFNESGAITASTLKTLMDNDLLQYLQFTENGLSLNTQALENEEQALKDEATAKLYSAMCNDIQNLSLEDTSQLSNIAQAAIANLDSAATTAGKNAGIAAQGWWEYGASIQSIPGVSGLTGDNQKKAQAIIKQYQNIARSINSISVGKTATSNSSSASKSAGKTMEDIQKQWKEYLDKYLAMYKAELDAGLIDFNTYLNKSRSLLDEYYRDGKIAAKDYWDSIKQLYENQLSVYDKVLSAVTRRIEKEVDGIQDIIDGLEKQNDALQKQLDEYDSILSVVDDVYQTEIDRLEEQKDLLQDKIDQLQDESDAYDMIRKKEEALYALRRAESQRTKKVFNGKEFVYSTDSNAIRDAKNTLQDIKTEELINNLQKEQEGLDAEIEKLQEYKEKWQEITSAKETEQNKQLAIALWGQDYEKFILQNRISDIENFKNNYVSIQKQIDDNSSLIDSYKEKIEYYQKLKEQWSSISDAYKQAQEDQYATMVLGAQWEKDVLNGRIDTLNKFKDEYIAIQQAITNAAYESAQAQANAVNSSSGGSIGSGGNSAQSSSAGVNANKTTITLFQEYVRDVLKRNISVNGIPDTATKDAIKYLQGQVGMTKNGSFTPELWEKVVNWSLKKNKNTDIYKYTSSGKYSKLYSARFEHGGVIKRNIQSNGLINALDGENAIIAAREGERVLTPTQNDMWEKWTQALPNLQNLSNMINVNVPDYSMLNNVVTRNNSIQPSFSIGEIHLHEVQNVDGLANAIIKELPSKVTQRLGK